MNYLITLNMLSLFLLISILTFCSGTIILPPKFFDNNTQDVGLVFVQGAFIPARNYQTFFQALQEKYERNLWIALVEFPFDMPEPLLMENEIKDAFSALEKANMNVTEQTPFFFGGHSLGGIMIQDYVLNKNNQEVMPVKVVGLILEGSYITRKNLNLIQNTNLISSILSISGELDGVNRISRMAESFYFDRKNMEKDEKVKRMTYIIPGMNHYQFAGEGEPPSNVKNNDILAEISNEEARVMATHIISSTIKAALKNDTDEERHFMNERWQETLSLLEPLIASFKAEGSYHLNTPCYKVNKTGENQCQMGSVWTKQSQQIMGGLNISMEVTDTFNLVYEEHIPAIHSNCINQTASECSLKITTVSQLVYSEFDMLDVSLYSTAASEIRTKMISRQSVLLAKTGKVVSFNETDSGNVCADINQAVIDYALFIAPDKVKARYMKNGTQLRVGDDIGPLNAGPLWIWTPLQYNKVYDSSDNRYYLEIRSPVMKTSVDFLIKSIRGFHYCKILSPAKAMEWIYVDSIKLSD